MSGSNAVEDPFESLHSLEENFYQAGYAAGVADGSRAGRIEGRVFGLEKGFEKFVELGKLAGRAEVWKQRFGSPTNGVQQSRTVGDSSEGLEKNIGGLSLENEELPNSTVLPRLNANARLEKHVATLWDLVEPATYDTRNTEDAVADFDDRFKRAKAKAKVIEKIIGEDDQISDKVSANRQSTAAQRRDIRISHEQAQEKNMEDFGRNLATR